MSLGSPKRSRQLQSRLLYVTSVTLLSGFIELLNCKCLLAGHWVWLYVHIRQITTQPERFKKKLQDPLAFHISINSWSHNIHKRSKIRLSSRRDKGHIATHYHILLNLLTASAINWVTQHGRRKWQPTPVFSLGESQRRGSLWAAVYGVAQSQTRLKWLSRSSSRIKSREGNGGEVLENPLQYSCLENPMVRGAWWAAVHGVTKSWTRLSD